jgi:hypothetical protein
MIRGKSIRMLKNGFEQSVRLIPITESGKKGRIKSLKDGKGFGRKIRMQSRNDSSPSKGRSHCGESGDTERTLEVTRDITDVSLTLGVGKNFPIARPSISNSVLATRNVLNIKIKHSELKAPTDLTRSKSGLGEEMLKTIVISADGKTMAKEVFRKGTDILHHPKHLLITSEIIPLSRRKLARVKLARNGSLAGGTHGQTPANAFDTSISKDKTSPLTRLNL